jgi:hypothetical protein
MREKQMKEATNYTSEMVAHMVERYSAEPNLQTVQELAEEMNRPVKSIIAKLSREGVYRKQPRLTKTGELPVRKEMLVSMIEGTLGFPVESFGKASKIDLIRLYRKLEELKVAAVGQV